MGRLSLLAAGAALVVGGVGAGVAGADLLDGDDDRDRPDRVVTIAAPAAGTAAPAASTLTVDDGVPVGEARAVARLATAHLGGGRAVSVDRDDGRYEVEVQRADGALVEVLLDGGRRVVGTELDDGDR
ncbi:hypothetical protein GKE82_12535 [Conexibacter sp. W3-3-2]|uniref:PepSY domain-containing protein n=1 Tax=Conexibacter sp. W3-3-2 TaxID=2675227 RepID=UPI0012B6F86B|nr:hypothetical protein [Conexibacter sp. W3-3-2]MTD45096.1 hypothetical protein [Conexibacter sp. W3-3-2]